MVTLHSLKELGEALHLLPAVSAAEPTQDIDTPAAPDAQPADLATLLATLQTASVALQAAVQRDAAAREEALAALERYEAALAGQREAADAHEAAHRVQAEAQAMAEAAFTDDCRAAAEAVAGKAARAVVAAAELLAERQRDVERLALALDVPRLVELRDRQRREAEERAREQERAQRRNAALAEGRRLLSAGCLGEAEAMLGPLLEETPEDGELRALRQQVREQALRGSIAAATMALSDTYRDLRRRPESAVRRLEALAVDDLPPDLARRVFGAWAEGCARLCRERGVDAPLRYAPDPGRGIVLVPDGDRGHTVLSALGLADHFPVGEAVPDHVVRRARPLRLAGGREG